MEWSDANLVPDSRRLQGGQSVAGGSQVFSSEHELRVFGHHDGRVQVCTQPNKAIRKREAMGTTSIAQFWKAES